MSSKKSWIDNIFMVCLLCAFLFSTSCTMYRNMQPTGYYRVLKREQVKELYTFRAVRMPDPEEPVLEVEFVKYPVYKERRQITKSGEKKNASGLVGGLILMGAGVGVAASEASRLNESSSTSDSTAFVGGVIGALVGFFWFFHYLAKENWKPTTTSGIDNVIVEDKQKFTRISNAKVKVVAPSILKEWEFTTDVNGRVALNIAEISEFVRAGSPLKITFQSLEGRHVSNDFSIASSFFDDLKEYYASIRPPELITHVTFDDANSWKANQMIDGAEEAFIATTIENRGEGKALDVKLLVDNSHPEVSINKEIYLGAIEPGEKIKKRLPLSVAMDIADGLATFTVQTKEQRGYDARPVKLSVRTRHLDKPALSFTTFKINDGATGMARGNNNGVAESDETLEISAFVRNAGVGPAMDTQLKVSTSSSAIQIRKDQADLQTLAPGETRQGKIVVHIPRTFAEKEIRLHFSAKDLLGASVVEREYRLPVKVRAPILAFDYAIFSSEGVQVQQVSNGEDYQLEITPRNDGTIAARNVSVSVSTPTSVQLREKSRSIAQIAAGVPAGRLLFPFSLPRTLSAKEVDFNIRMTQSDFSPVQKTVLVPFLLRKPQLAVQARFLSAAGKSAIYQGDYGELNIVVQNTGTLSAERVAAMLAIEDAGIDLLSNPQHVFDQIPPGATMPHKFRFYVKNSARPGSYAPTLRITQADGFPGIDKTLTLNIQEVGAVVVEVTGKEDITPFPPPLPGVAGGQPPKVKVVALGVDANNRSYEQQVKLRITVNDDKPLLGLQPEILVNGRTETQETLLRGIGMTERQQRLSERAITFIRMVQLQDGRNDIEVRFMDSDNEMDSDRTTVLFREKRSDVYALIVGVSEYKHADIEPLRYAHRDAQKFADFLQSAGGGKVPNDHITILVNDAATRGNIMKHLNQVLGRALKDDVIYVYMAMHAETQSGDLFFLAHDSDPAELLGTGIEQSQIQRPLQNAVQRNKVVWITDVCHAGAIGPPTLAKRSGRARRVNQLMKEMAKARNGMAVFMAASGNQTSRESDRWNGGVFTKYLIEGLRGAADSNQNNLVTLSELADYLPRAVIEATNKRQRPEVGGNFDGSLPVGIVKKTVRK